MAVIKGGEKFEAKMAELAERLNRPETLQVGFFEGSTYPSGQSVPEVAAFNEFGTATSPPRPFFRNMIHDKSGEWPDAIAGLLKTHDVNTTLALAGEAIKGQLQKSINDLTSPPLSPRTIKRKGFEKPLIDTSVMINSVGYQIKS